MELLALDAEQIAMDFLMNDLEIPAEERDFFTILSARHTGSEWYVVEIGIEGLPDKWVLQVFDTGDCDPCYTFVSPMPPGEDSDLAEFPESIAVIVAAERRGERL
ncbi:MAG TPA: hypothetical protein IGS37_20085 [Synechococcales cyanobacterium M55_K2018_004]|nr:hypothetical protein [Synechococcales cyanobacterium M55_K2018_004]